MSVEDVQEFLRVSPTTLRKKLRKGEFPKPFDISSSGKSHWRWARSQIDEWVDEQLGRKEIAVRFLVNFAPYAKDDIGVFSGPDLKMLVELRIAKRLPSQSAIPSWNELIHSRERACEEIARQNPDREQSVAG